MKKRGTISLAQARPDLVPDWDYDKNDCTPDDVSFGSTKRVHWKCHTCGREWTTTVNQRTATADIGMGCRVCSQPIRVIKCAMTKRHKALLPDTFNCTLTKYVAHIPTNHLRCPICNHIWKIDSHSIPPHTDVKCPECAKALLGKGTEATQDIQPLNDTQPIKDTQVTNTTSDNTYTDIKNMFLKA